LISKEETVMRMMLKTLLAGALVSLAAVALSAAANAANLGACGSSGANLLSDFVNANGTSNGNTCTVGDKTYSMFLYLAQGDFAPGGGNPVPASLVSVAAINDHTCQFSNNSCQGLLFTANWKAIGADGDAAINFAVTAPTATIMDAELGLSGATGLASDTANYFIGSLGGTLLGQRVVNAAGPQADLTFPGTPPTPQTTVFVSDNLNVPAGSAASDLDKEVSQNTTPPDHPCTHCLSDSEEPGSVIVFPKFIQGSVILPERVSAPISELEIGIVCPKGDFCSEHQSVKLRLHWVCGSTQADLDTSFVCKETDFDLTATVYEKIVITPNGEAVGQYTDGLPNHFAPAANCPRQGGYLIAWVIDPANDRPVKFDGLIGDAHLRPGSPAAAGNMFAGSPTALADYKAIPIQADPGLATFPATDSAITTNAAGALFFDSAPGHYQQVTGQVFGDIRYTNLTTGPTFTLGVLTLLTLDVRSNRPNRPTFVDLDFFGGNPSLIGNENQLSTSTEFICWEEVPITAINADLTTANMGRKGVFGSAPAADNAGNPMTLLGLSEVLEGGVFPPVGPWPRASFTGLFNSSVGVPTRFVPTPSPNFLP
jgi:hypothetical protein